MRGCRRCRVPGGSRRRRGARARPAPRGAAGGVPPARACLPFGGAPGAHRAPSAPAQCAAHRAAAPMRSARASGAAAGRAITAAAAGTPMHLGCHPSSSGRESPQHRATIGRWAIEPQGARKKQSGGTPGRRRRLARCCNCHRMQSGPGALTGALRQGEAPGHCAGLHCAFQRLLPI